MQNKIHELIKDAMRSKDGLRLMTLRGMLAAFTNELVATRRKPQEVLTEEECISVIRRLVKQRRDSIEQFEKGGRKDLADSERDELTILEEFLPAQMSEDKIREIALKKKEEMGITDKSKMGQLVGAVIKETKGEADGGTVKKVVDEILS